MSPERNKPCPCGSGKKYKRCCYLTEHTQRELEQIELEEVRRRAARARQGARPALTMVAMAAAMGGAR